MGLLIRLLSDDVQETISMQLELVLGSACLKIEPVQMLVIRGFLRLGCDGKGHLRVPVKWYSNGKKRVTRSFIDKSTNRYQKIIMFI